MTANDNAASTLTGNVGDEIYAAVGRWTFGAGVHRTFDEHVVRSIPMYREGHELTLALSDFFVRAGGTVYELGCSTGTLTHGLATRHRDRAVRVIGVDIEPEMIDAARRRCSNTPNAHLVLGDIRGM